MRALFYGGVHLNNVHALYSAFYTLRQQGLAEVVVTDEPGAASLVRDFARAENLSVIEVPAPWLLHGDMAEQRRRQVMVDTGPDMIVLLPGGEPVWQMVALADARELPVWDLRDMAFVRLGDEGQLGEISQRDDEKVF